MTPKRKAPGTEGTEGKASQACRQSTTNAVARQQCVSLIERLTGSKAGVEHFLATTQPALENRTGRELLEDEPAELLRRLRELEEGRIQ